MIGIGIVLYHRLVRADADGRAITRISVDCRPGPHVASVGGRCLGSRHVLLLRINERPDFIDLNATAIEIAEARDPDARPQLGPPRFSIPIVWSGTVPMQSADKANATIKGAHYLMAGYPPPVDRGGGPSPSARSAVTATDGASLFSSLVLV